MPGGPDLLAQTPTAPRVYAQLSDYEAIVTALERRRLECDVSYKTLGDASSLQAGFLSNAMGPSQSRRFGLLSLFFLVAPLGLRFALVEAPELAARYAEAMPKRKSAQARPGNLARPVAERVRHRVFKELARRGAKATNSKLTPEQRSGNARRAALKRHHPHWRRWNPGAAARREQQSTPA